MADATRNAPIDLPELYYRMAFTRRFEERLLDRFRNKELTGTTHTYVGQEATAVAALSLLRPGDFVCSQHRSHGYFLAPGGNARDLFLEILGDVGGVCNGVGGSQHLYMSNFLSNGILDGTVGLAAGLGLAEKLKNSGNIVIGPVGGHLLIQCPKGSPTGTAKLLQGMTLRREPVYDQSRRLARKRCRPDRHRSH